MAADLSDGTTRPRPDEPQADQMSVPAHLESEPVTDQPTATDPEVDRAAQDPVTEARPGEEQDQEEQDQEEQDQEEQDQEEQSGEGSAIDRPGQSGEDSVDAEAPRWRIPMALATWAFVVLVLLIVVVLLVLKVTRGTTTAPTPPETPASASVVQAATSVPASVFNKVGASQTSAPAPEVLTGQPALVISGLPAVVYVGGEFCPYCAAERWSLVVALSRFGKFSNLGATSSSKFEVFSSTPTFSFNGASYHSRYLTFSATEQYGQSPSAQVPAGFPQLDTLPPQDAQLIERYGTISSGTPILPFVDVGNKLVSSGAAVGFSPALLQGTSMGKIASELSDPTSAIGEAIVGEANVLTASICSATGGAPQTVCASPAARAGAARSGLK